MTPQPVKPRILVVDDHPANRLAYETVLEGAYTVFLADSGRQALDVSRRVEFAVILLDVRMPEMDGYETAVELRRREPTRYTPIVFTSAIDQTLSHVNRGFVVGATDYIFSPVDPEFLKFKVATYTQMFLRNEGLRIQIARLNELIHSLRAEIDENVSLDASLKARTKELEGLLDELKRQSVATY
jgi:two-component system, sporulation sensor kinase E